MKTADHKLTSESLFLSNQQAETQTLLSFCHGRQRQAAHPNMEPEPDDVPQFHWKMTQLKTQHLMLFQPQTLTDNTSNNSTLGSPDRRKHFH